MAEAYLCIGDESWTSRIEDPSLRWLILILQDLACKDTHFRNERGRLVAKLYETARDIVIPEKYRKCLWDAVGTTIETAFCNDESSTVLQILIKGLTLSWCSAFPEIIGANMVCFIGNFLLDHTTEIKASVGEYLCSNHDNDQIGISNQISRVKRVFDLRSVVDLIDQLACLYPESMVSMVKEGGFVIWKIDTAAGDNAAAVSKIVSPFLCCLVDYTRENSAFH